LLKINCEEEDEWFVFANESLHYGEFRKKTCLDKKLSDIERRTLVPTRTRLKMLGLPWSNESSVPLPYEPIWFLDKILLENARALLHLLSSVRGTRLWHSSGLTLNPNVDLKVKSDV
jgi:hypothetical protein